MPSIVSTNHPDYTKKADKWRRCRDVVAGADAVKAAGVRYLPALKDQSTDEYNAYKDRAKWFGATWRTIEALKGMIFRKPPQVEAAESIKPFLDDVTLTGKSLMVFAHQVVLDVLTTGRVGVLVDYPQHSTEGLTLADAQALNLRPTLAMYPTESITNWKTERIGNATVLSLLVLTEDAALDGNEFEHNTETRYRVLDLAAIAGDDGSARRVYRVRVFRVKDGEDEQIGADLFPLMNGSPLSAIPFFFLGVDDTTPDVDDPPLIDLCDLNLDHYRLSADHKHGLHFTGLPTAWIAGYTKQEEGEKLYLGSSHAWIFPDPQAKAGFLEFTGVGLSSISDEMACDKEEMATIGARLLTAEKKATETAQAARIYRAGESSILAAIAGTISDGLTKALRVFSEWAGVKDDSVKVELNRDFMPPEVTPEELAGILQSWQAGLPGFSDQGVFDMLQRKEVIAVGVTLEEEQARIGEKRPPAPDGTGEGV